MSYCCPHDEGAARLFSRFARRTRRRYERRGFEPSQRQLLEGLARAGFAQAVLLDIGCGVGYLHQHLLEQGAASVTGIDLAAGAIKQARAAAERRGLAGRADYRVGDFVEIAGEVPAADVVILDKVICCYPDAGPLVRESVARARRAYAYTMPRDRWLTRAGVAVVGAALRLFGSPFRNYVHDPRRIEAWIAEQGLVERYRDETTLWLTRVFVRPGAS